MVYSDISRFIGYILFQMLGFITCRLCSSAHAYSLSEIDQSLCYSCSVIAFDHSDIVDAVF